MKLFSTEPGLDGYLAKEFEVLSQAHFQTSQKTTTFFQFISVIFLAPFAIFAVPGLEMSILLGGILLVIGFLGFCITMYLADLRFESLLYARAVNKIRLLIYSKSSTELSPTEQVSFINDNSILFAQPRKPNYFDTNQFLWIVLGLGGINSFYLSYSVRIILSVTMGVNLTLIRFILVAFVFCLVHLLVYFHKSNTHEKGSIYYENVIGADIDGVISNQNAQFVKFYNLANEEKISEDDIVTLPVHKSGKISQESEKEIFQKDEYWRTMEVLPMARDSLSHLRDNGFKIALFTLRPWELEEANLRDLTKRWLEDNQIQFNSLGFDNKNTTRIDEAQSKKIKYFIEDDLIKAERLCAICKVVFLVDYRYNQTSRMLPYNLIRVQNLSDVVLFISQLN
ncbi:MAG: hypothetical protein GX660_09650 [Clostridiaceae bacterium]|nr:hypothetical protein [Clostridiaceae bacterium]